MKLKPFSNFFIYIHACLSLWLFSTPALSNDPVNHQDNIEEVIVTADFHNQTPIDFNASVSLFDEQDINQRQIETLDELFALAPNVNFASGASRGRFIQIRGIGERGEFVQPVNYSVGVVLDGIELTGLGLAASLLDIEQVEILRGPQGTLYGASALAGMVNLVSNPVDQNPTASASLSIGSQNLQTLQATGNVPINEQLGLRIAVRNQQSDGFIANDYLNRKDSNNIDESVLKTRLSWQQSDEMQLDATLLLVDADNGYDAFSLDNNQHSLSDQPGYDRQSTQALSVTQQLSQYRNFDLQALLSLGHSDVDYAYDEDWSYPEICDGLDCEGWAYSSFDRYQRQHDNYSADVQIRSKQSQTEHPWTFGIYAKTHNIQLTREYTYAATDFESDYDTQNLAVYGEQRLQLSNDWSVTTGLRLEQRAFDYQDNNAQSFSTTEDLWGGKLSLDYALDDQQKIYALVSRGYKAGGVNPNAALPEHLKVYDNEFLWNYELGIKGWFIDQRLQADAAIFYQDRYHIQTDQSLVTPLSGTDCPCSFEDYIDNAAKGYSTGVETTLEYQLNDKLSLDGAIGLLQSQYTDYINYSHVDADADTGEGVDMSGRALSHAPEWQYALGMNLAITQAMQFRIEQQAKDRFYLGDGHDEQSKAYQLWNASLGWQDNHWSVVLWGKNLTDAEYVTRGFGSFGNDPRKFYSTEPYYQFGPGRSYGITIGYTF